MIVCNDVWAYIFGFFLGRTPLIQLSPKKTWEGFIGGGVATIIFGLCVSMALEIYHYQLNFDLKSLNKCLFNLQASYFLCQYRYFVCPIEYSETLGRMSMDCEPGPLFRPTEYTLPDTLHGVLALVRDIFFFCLLSERKEGKKCQFFFSFNLQFNLRNTVTIYPFLLHSLSMSLFSSVIGPFGGFFASGFKRAFKIKVSFFFFLKF